MQFCSGSKRRSVHVADQKCEWLSACPCPFLKRSMCASVVRREAKQMTPVARLEFWSRNHSCAASDHLHCLSNVEQIVVVFLEIVVLRLRFRTGLRSKMFSGKQNSSSMIYVADEALAIRHFDPFCKFVQVVWIAVKRSQ